MKNIYNENIKMPKKSRRLLRFVFFVALVFVLTGVNLVIVDRYLLPYMATVKWLSKSKLFKKATEDVVIINKTEQVTVSEEQTVSRYSNKSSASVVEIISKKNPSASASKKAKSEEQSKIGSGFIVTADGLVITYQDAILDSDAQYKIFSSDGDGYDGRLIFKDPYTNLALMKIDGVENLPTASFIAPEDVKVGAKLVLMGRIESDTQIVFKSGLISQLAESYSIGGPLAQSEKLQGVYLTDAQFNNAGDENLIGAAAADFNGDIVGILGARLKNQQPQYFIIPVNHIKYLVDQYLASGGAVKRGSLGVYYLNLTKEDAYLVGSQYDHGALIYSPSLQQGLAIISGSSADKAGLKLMDVILAVNGEEINPNQNLAFLISKYKSGEEVSLKVARDGKEMEIKVVLN